MLTLSFLLWSTASLLTPTTAQNSRAITAARVLVGVAQGFIIPSIHTMLSQARHSKPLQSRAALWDLSCNPERGLSTHSPTGSGFLFAAALGTTYQCNLEATAIGVRLNVNFEYPIVHTNVDL
jgi:hypothetical protein